jgi:type IV pilus assembly protein PilM
VGAMGTRTKQAQGGGRPTAAVELTPQGVLAAALPARNAPTVYAFESLPAGALTPTLTETNVQRPEVLAAAIRAALEAVAPRTRAVTIVLPDTAVRVFVLDFDSLPSSAAETLEVLRFRLRKMVPFDVERAGLSFQILSAGKQECRVLVATMAAPVLEEYESAVRAAGFDPGAVLPAGLAALAGLQGEEPVLAACMNGLSLTTAITRGADLLLYRTADLPADAAQRLAEVQRDIAVAAAYFEDTMATRPERLLYAGIGSAEQFARWTGERDLRVVEMAERPTSGVITALGELSVAGIAGALAGASA